MHPFWFAVIVTLLSFPVRSLYGFESLVIADQQTIPLKPWLYRLQLTNTDDASIQQLTEPWTMTHEAVDNIYIGFIDKPVVFGFALENPDSDSMTRVLNVGVGYLDEVVLYTLKDGQWTVDRQGAEHAAKQKGLRPNFLLELPPGRSIFLLKVKASVPALIVPLEIQKLDNFLGSSWNQAYVLFGIFGAIVALIGFNLSLSIILRSTIYLTYAAYQFSYVISTARVEGILSALFGEWTPLFIRNEFSLFWIHLGYIFATIFIVKFLDFKTRRPLLNKWLYPYIAFCLTGGCINFFLPKIGYMFFAYAYPNITGVYILFGVIEAFRGRPSAVIFALGWIPVIVGQFFIAGIYNNWLPYHEEFLVASHVAVLFEALIFSIALALRFKEDQAQSRYAIETLNSELQKRDQERTHFFHNISHELRTPLNGILGYITILESQSFQLGEVAREKLQKIVFLTLSLKNQVNAILDLAKYRSGSIGVKPLNLAMNEILNYIKIIAEGLKSTYPQVSYFIECNWQENENPRWASDGDKLTTIIRNLVSNAFKFSDAKRENHVHISLALQTDQLLIRVSDTGIGIAPSEQSKIFEEFKQVEMSANRRYEGTGLGLSLVKGYVGLLDGNIHVKSEPGQGTTIDVLLPRLSDQPLEASPILPPEDVKRFLASEATGTMPELLPANLDPASSIAGTRALIIDDNIYNQEVLAFALHSMGVQVETVGHAREALKQIEIQDFDLIFVDLMMPEVSGFELLQQLRQRSLAEDTSIIVVTAMGSIEDSIRALTLGAIDVITKPFHAAELNLRVRNIIMRLKGERDRETDLAGKRLGHLSEMLADFSHEVKNLLSLDHDDHLELARNLFVDFKDRSIAWRDFYKAITGLHVNDYAAGKALFDQLQQNGLIKKKEQRAFGRHISDYRISPDHARLLMEDFTQMPSNGQVSLMAMLQAYSLLVGQERNQKAIRELISSILDYSRTGPSQSEAGLRRHVDAVLSLLKKRLERNRIEVETSGDDIMCRVNPMEIRQVLLNLIGNACDALLQQQEDRRKITVTLESKNNRAQIHVSDSGPGIDASMKDRIFERNFSTKQEQGNGIGLYLVRYLAHKNRGDVKLESLSNPTTFTLDLPLNHEARTVTPQQRISS